MLVRDLPRLAPPPIAGGQASGAFSVTLLLELHAAAFLISRRCPTVWFLFFVGAQSGMDDHALPPQGYPPSRSISRMRRRRGRPKTFSPPSWNRQTEQSQEIIWQSILLHLYHKLSPLSPPPLPLQHFQLALMDPSLCTLSKAESKSTAAPSARSTLTPCVRGAANASFIKKKKKKKWRGSSEREYFFRAVFFFFLSPSTAVSRLTLPETGVA